MKLATYSDGSRDGQLVVVSRDLRHAHYATHVAGRLQQVLDDWNFLSPQLQDIYDSLNSGRAPHAFAFDPARCMAPLPRAYQCVQADPWLPEALTPQLEQAVSDPLHAAHAGLLLPSERAQGDLAVGLAVVTGDLPQGASGDQALAGIRLLMLCSQLRWQGVDDAVLAQPFTAFSPVALKPDELGDSWQDGRLQLTLQFSGNGRKLGMCDAGSDMAQGLHELLARLCTTRPLRAGSILCAAPVRNQDTRKGQCSLADRRALEQQRDGQISTPWLQPGDVWRAEARSRQGSVLFGALQHEVAFTKDIDLS